MSMYERRRKITINEIQHQPAVLQLDEYIRSHERRSGMINSRRSHSTNQAKLCQSFEQLKEAIRRDKRHREKAYEHLKDSNKTMKRTVTELREGFKTCRESIRNELQKIESANTERLLNIDPSSLYCNFRERQ